MRTEALFALSSGLSFCCGKRDKLRWMSSLGHPRTQEDCIPLRTVRILVEPPLGTPTNPNDEGPLLLVALCFDMSIGGLDGSDPRMVLMDSIPLSRQ